MKVQKITVQTIYRNKNNNTNKNQQINFAGSKKDSSKILKVLKDTLVYLFNIPRTLYWANKAKAGEITSLKREKGEVHIGVNMLTDSLNVSKISKRGKRTNEVLKI